MIRSYMANNIVLELQNIVKEYQLGDNTLRVLDGINLKIREGELVAIIGPSGSGKSTMLQIIGLLDKYTSGDLKFLGKDTLKYSEVELAKLRNEYLGFIFQQFNLLPKTSSVENVLLPFYYSGKKNLIEARARAVSLLEKVGLGSRLSNYPNQLSGGQQQRVAIARALMNDPKIIFADEPTGNLDSKSGAEVVSILKGLHKDGKTVIIVTHDPAIAKMAERQVKMFDGKIVEDSK